MSGAEGMPIRTAIRASQGDRFTTARLILFIKTVGISAGLITALALVLAQPALARKAPRVFKHQPYAAWTRSSAALDVKCIERSFSVSVGNPAYPNRQAVWPAPCGR